MSRPRSSIQNSKSFLIKFLLKVGAGAGVRIEAEAVGDSVYHWSVRLSRFAAGSPAQKFLGLLERAHGYGHVELDVRFAMDLYPFFPPVVRLVRPRVGDDALQRVAQLPSLRLSGWDSVRGMAPVLRDVAAVVAAEVAAARGTTPTRRTRAPTRRWSTC